MQRYGKKKKKEKKSTGHGVCGLRAFMPTGFASQNAFGSILSKLSLRTSPPTSFVSHQPRLKHHTWHQSFQITVGS